MINVRSRKRNNIHGDTTFSGVLLNNASPIDTLRVTDENNLSFASATTSNVSLTRVNLNVGLSQKYWLRLV